MQDLISLINDGTINRNRVIFGNLTLYFSYDTIVGFKVGSKVVCRENDWGTTTGKYLNDIEPNKKLRVEKDVFEKNLVEAFENEILEIKNDLDLNACKYVGKR